MQENQADHPSTKTRTYDFTKIVVRSDFTPLELRRIAATEKDRRVATRILAIANSMEGMKRRDTADLADVGLGTLQKWINAFNKSGVEGLRMRERGGRRLKLSAAQLSTFKDMVLEGRFAQPDIRRWTARFICGEVERRFGVRYTPDSLCRLLRSLGFHWQGGRCRQRDTSAIQSLEKQGHAPELEIQQRPSPPQ
jgi:transposase